MIIEFNKATEANTKNNENQEIKFETKKSRWLFKTEIALNHTSRENSHYASANVLLGVTAG